MADRNRDEARIFETEEELAEIEHSDSEESSIDAFKRIIFDKWASAPCPWGRMTGCKEVFLISEFEKLVAHTKKVHFLRRGARSIYIISPPASNYCGFCDAKFEADSGHLSWSNMMAHVVKEHYMLGHRLAHARIVWPLIEYLWQNGLLTPTQYRDLKPKSHVMFLPPPGLSDDEDPIALVEERRYRGGQGSVGGIC